MSDSIWDDPRITSYVLNELPENEREKFESELESNADLVTAVNEARGVTDQLHVLYEAEVTGQLDSERREAIGSGRGSEALMRRKNDPAKKHRAPSFMVPMMVMAVAAVLLLLVGIAPWMRQAKTITAIESTGIVKPAQQNRNVPAETNQDLERIDQDAAVVDLEAAYPMRSEHNPRSMQYEADVTSSARGRRQMGRSKSSDPVDGSGNNKSGDVQFSLNPQLPEPQMDVSADASVGLPAAALAIAG